MLIFSISQLVTLFLGLHLNLGKIDYGSLLFHKQLILQNVSLLDDNPNVDYSFKVNHLAIRPNVSTLSVFSPGDARIDNITMNNIHVLCEVKPNKDNTDPMDDDFKKVEATIDSILVTEKFVTIENIGVSFLTKTDRVFDNISSLSIPNMHFKTQSEYSSLAKMIKDYVQRAKTALENELVNKGWIKRP
eukprot:TRINITY_DN9687_c0_g1_i1.p1 TRINITY_DN9687_c0_g1~~TRINITY_DN9687_c0_g1_i1.p1  ORF type:complete len:189 (-),score=41.01 TRINITY_DN9687_c0_g1_i1:37-603(-)